MDITPLDWQLTAALAVSLALLAAAIWVSRPSPWVGRWLFRLAVLAMLIGLVLPPAAIHALRDALLWWAPLRELSEQSGSAAWMHGLLFAGVSTLLFWIRPELFRPALLAMVAVAFMMEGLQLLVAGRHASWWDVGLNLLGVAVAIGLRDSDRHGCLLQRGHGYGYCVRPKLKRTEDRDRAA